MLPFDENGFIGTNGISTLNPVSTKRILSQFKLQTGLCLAIAFTTWGSPPQNPPSSIQHTPTEETQKMAERLKDISRQSKPLDNPFLNDRRIELLKEKKKEVLQLPNGPEKLPSILVAEFQYAAELMLAGDIGKSIMEFNNLETFIRHYQLRIDKTQMSNLKFFQMLAHLLKGERENCIAHQHEDSCLFPIFGGGIHQEQAGSRRGASLALKQLQKDPKDLRARWFLNYAYSTLGEYPDKVPKPWLIPSEKFTSDYDIGRFRNVAEQAGINDFGLAGGVVAEDFDLDADMDLMVSSWGLDDPLKLFRNEGNGAFVETSQFSGLEGLTGGLNLIQADYDNDGDADVLVLRGAWFGKEGRHPNSLLRNNGNFTFDDVTESSGLLSFHPTQAACWFDFDNDGWIDLFIGNESSQGDLNPCQLYRNNGNGSFTEMAEASGVAATAHVKAVTAGDVDGDGFPDLYLSCKGQPNILFRNEGSSLKKKDSVDSWRFRDITHSAGVTEPKYSFPTWFWDYDNDGDQDLFVAGYAMKDVGDVAADYLGMPHHGERSKLYRNNSDGTFSDVSQQAGLSKLLLAMAANYGDLDNDGYLDFYLGTGNPDLSSIMPNRMFRNHKGSSFQDVTSSGGFGHLQKGHGIAFADFDNDGDQDVYAVLGGAYSGDRFWNSLFLNPGHGNRWLKLKLTGTQSNRSAIGTQIKVTIETESGERTIYKTTGSGGSFGASPLRQEIGLGNAKTIQSLEIFWPTSGTRQRFENVKLNSFYHIREEDKNPSEIQLKSFSFKSTSGHSNHQHPTN
ncbi:MAG TPA: CRTAC1 family protein [Verrucomicrobiales bacterium]|nr:CRTAC1 family protein [Verrucomicrobiales bacterium]